MATKRKKRVAKPVVQPKPRERYGTFYEAWPKVPELRKYTTQHGWPRFGLEGADRDKALALIDEYKDG